MKPTEPPASVLTARDHAELESARAKHMKLLGRADEAIQAAMAHADEVFRYKGPERRGRPR